MCQLGVRVHCKSVAISTALAVLFGTHDPPVTAGKAAVITIKGQPQNRARSMIGIFCKEHHLIETFFAKLKQFSAIATRYDRPRATFLLPVTSPRAPFCSIGGTS
jgi:hypothetical protein